MSATNTQIHITRDYRAQYPNPIQAESGALLEVGKDDPEHPGWRWCTAPDGRAGWVPESFLEYSFGGGAVLTRDYSAVELSVRTGEVATIEEARAGWALVRAGDGSRGWIPLACGRIEGVPSRTITIRPERPEDAADVVKINDDAFAGTAESRLVTAVKQSSRPVISLIACSDDAPVGHIFFSPIQIQSDGPMIATLALAPMAVLPAFQRQGIGTRLVEAGLGECARQGCQVVVVVGHPTFYGRFGFRPASGMGLRSVYSSAGDAFMALELSARVLAGRTGFVEYPAEFANV